MKTNEKKEIAFLDRGDCYLDCDKVWLADIGEWSITILVFDSWTGSSLKLKFERMTWMSLH